MRTGFDPKDVGACDHIQQQLVLQYKHNLHWNSSTATHVLLGNDCRGVIISSGLHERVHLGLNGVAFIIIRSSRDAEVGGLCEGFHSIIQFQTAQFLNSSTRDPLPPLIIMQRDIIL